MKTDTLLLIAALAVGGYFIYRKTDAGLKALADTPNKVINSTLQSGFDAYKTFLALPELTREKYLFQHADQLPYYLQASYIPNSDKYQEQNQYLSQFIVQDTSKSIGNLVSQLTGGLIKI